jgi:hypothetical protein
MAHRSSSSSIMFEIIILSRLDRQSFAAGKSRFKSLLEFCRSVGAVDYY